MPKDYRIESTDSYIMNTKGNNPKHLEETADVLRYMKDKNYHIGKVSFLLFCQVHEPDITL